MTLGTPWWDVECSKAVAKRRQARRRLCKSPTLSNLISCKRFSAIAKHTVIQKKKECWRSYVVSLSLDTPTGRVWRIIRSINGVCSARPVLMVEGPEAPLNLKAQLLLEHFVPPTASFLRANEVQVNEVVSELCHMCSMCLISVI